MKKPASAALEMMIKSFCDQNIHSIEDAKRFARPIEEWSPEEVRDALKSIGIKGIENQNNTCHNCAKYGYPECQYFPEEPPAVFCKKGCVKWGGYSMNSSGIGAP